MNKRTLTPPHLHAPQRWSGMRIGLLGGSFNPPHAGHYHIAKTALITYNLDFIWWVVTPQNPLKETKNMMPYDKRFRLVEDMLTPHPRMMATHLESDLGSRYTYKTVQGIQKHFSKTEFLWICGMDNAHIFHKWDRWKDILADIPIVFIARPPADSQVRNSPVRMFSDQQKTPESRTNISLKPPKTYWLNGSKLINISSTRIRKMNKKQ